MGKAGCRGCFTIFCAGAVCLSTLLAICFWHARWTPSPFATGPCVGELRTIPPTREPDQIFLLFEKFKLEVYDAIENETAPTVLLREREGGQKWCIYATADGRQHTKVNKLRFQAWRFFPFDEPRARGVVWWTHGQQQRMIWLITQKGELTGYWYYW